MTTKKNRRHVRMFKPQFADKVQRGEKLQTVRPIPKRMPRVRETISLRAWEGKPYRSKQKVLAEGIINRVRFCRITGNGVWLESTLERPEDFAKADGFDSFDEMAAWFKATHGLPFEGILIAWELVVPVRTIQFMDSSRVKGVMGKVNQEWGGVFERLEDER